MSQNHPPTEEDLKTDKEMHEMMHKIIEVINGHPVEVTGIAMITLLVINCGLDKKTFMYIVNKIWDYHNGEENDNRS